MSKGVGEAENYTMHVNVRFSPYMNYQDDGLLLNSDIEATMSVLSIRNVESILVV